ncbi:MAG: tetratricopeptide repeat protein [Bacteroidota bacterium]|nr:tetratricopeptide repeat protein [Bacteroidota bacterium]
MKTSPGTDHLSPKELADLLNGKTDAKSDVRIKKLLKDCELSKEALAGFTAVPAAAADIASLNKQIAVKSGMIKTPVWMSVVTVVIGLALVAGMGYALWPREPEVLQIPLAYTVPPVTTPASTPSVDLTPKAEHFVNPEAKPKPLAVISQGKPTDTTTVKSTEEKQDPISVANPPLLEVKPVVPKNPEAGYNASIGFIQDLKVTEFEKYYRKTIEVRELPLKGVPAQFEDDDKRKKEDEMETVRNVPAEQFLNDGLRAFHDGKYGRCIEKMEVLKKNNAKDLNAAFYMGVSYVKLEMFEKAIKMFDEVLNASNNVFHEEAKWYKALALIGNGDTLAAKQLLEEIAAKDGFYKEKAVAKMREIQ